MIDFIPLKDYAYYFYQIICAIFLITYLHTLVLNGHEQRTYNYNRNLSILLLLFTIPYIGLRPISGRYFVDMKTYAQTFEQFKNGMPIKPGGDLGFELFLKISSQTMTVELFFLMCAMIYIIPLFLAAKNWFPNYYFFAFLLLV